MKKVTGIVVRKYAAKSLPIGNGGLYTTASSHKRPIQHFVELEGGCTAKVTSSEFREYKVGETVTVSCEEPKDLIGSYLIVILAMILIFIACWVITH